MDIFLAILFSVTGILLIIKGGDWFVESASWIARAAKIPTFIVGATIVSFATTLPEMIVSLIASIQGKNEMAIGNAVGSVSANTGLIMGLAFIFMTVTTPRKDYWRQILLLVGTAIILWLGCLQGKLALWSSLILIIIFIVFIILNVFQARRNEPNRINLETQPNEPVTEPEKIIVNKKALCKNLLFFVLGAAGIILGSNLLINGGSTLATKLGIPERVIAVTMVAIGTSLPELVTTITAIRKKEASLSVGNIIGANIIDLSLILPICSFVSGQTFTVSTQCLQFDFPACLIISLIAVMPMLIKQRAYKWQGVLMLLVYTTYIVISSCF